MFGLAREILKKQLLPQCNVNLPLTGVLSITENGECNGIGNFTVVLDRYLLASFLIYLNILFSVFGIRFASKKTGGSTKNRKEQPRPKHRRIHINDGVFVQKGNILVRQRNLRFHAGLNVSN